MAFGANFSGGGSTHPDRSAIVSYQLWKEAFSGDRAAVGRTILVDGESYTVAGVLPERFQFPRSDASFFDEGVGLVIPVANVAESWGRASSQWFAIGRLATGAGVASAEAELNTIAAHAQTARAGAQTGSIRVSALQELTTRKVRPALLLVMASSGVLLLIACVNVMNLWFSRSLSRTREVVIRKAIGAGTPRLVRQFLTEGACLTVAAGTLGVVLARAVEGAIVRVSPVHVPVVGAVDIDRRVLGFALLVCAATTLATTLLPSLRSSMTHEHLASAGTRVSRGRTLTHVQRALTVAQVALGLALLTAAGLLVNSLLQLGAVEPGFRTDGVLGFSVSVPSDHPADRRTMLWQRVLDNVRAIPGVSDAGWISNLPPEQRKGVFIPFTIAGRVPSRPDERMFCNFQVTSETYFRTLNIPLTAGRAFNVDDDASGARVAIVNESLARRYFGDVSPIGGEVKTAFDGRPRQIVGVIAGIHDRGLAVPSVPTIYVPLRQSAAAFGSIALRSTLPPAQIVPQIRARIREIDPSIPVAEFETLGARVHRSLGEPRFYTVIAAVCAVMAVVFVTLGLYAVIAFSVARRTAEIGIRVAMGAQRTTIQRMVVGEGLLLGAIGAAIGGVIAFAVARLLTAWLFGVPPADPVTFAASTALLLAVMLLASYVPARRASRIDPLVALRHE